MSEPDIEAETGTAIALPDQRGIVALFGSPQAVDALLAKIEREVANRPAQDLNTLKGRKAVAALAYQVARTKTMLDEAGKRLNDDARIRINVVDAERRKIRDRCDRLQAVARAPLDAWEAKEERRVIALRGQFSIFDCVVSESDTAADLQAFLERIEAIEIGPDWQEFSERALQAKDAILRTLRTTLRTAQVHEAQIAEIARLRAEADARTAAEAASLEAERIERQRVLVAEVEAARAAAVEAERLEIAARATKAAEAKAAAESAAREIEAERQRQKVLDEAEAHRLKVLAEAEALRQAEAQKAATDLQAAAAREAKLQLDLETARKATEQAAQAERDKLACERRAEAEARALRQADAQHRAHIRSDIIAALRTMKGKASPELIADALMDGLIPHVTVQL